MQIEGFFIYNSADNELINIPRYDFGEDLTNYVESAFQENAAYKAIWDKEPLSMNLASNLEPQSNQIIREATEYFILDNLCTHLVDYFANGKFNSEKLETHTRDQIPSNVLSNRFLDLFSRHMKDRPAFVQEVLDKEAKDGDDTAMTWAEKGEFFNKFELRVPQKSRIERIDNSTTNLVTRNLNMTVEIKFDGYNHLLPRQFDEYYLGINQFDDNIQIFQIDIVIKVLFKFGILFFNRGSEYYRWIDSFLEEIESKFSGTNYFKFIGWNSAITVIECIKELLPENLTEYKNNEH